MKSRAITKLHDSLERRLATYAMAAGAAGLGLTATAQPAAAKIIYTKTNTQLTSTPLPLDLNHDGVTDFELAYVRSEFFFDVSVKPEQSNRIVGYCRNVSCRRDWASALHPGVKVGRNQRLGPYNFMVRGECDDDANKGEFSTCSGYGPWVDVRNRYLGLEFLIKGGVHYGWARLNVSVGKPVTAVLTGYAYETIPNKPIVTGKTKGSDQPAGLGHLALGASAISTWRLKQNAATAH